MIFKITDDFKTIVLEKKGEEGQGFDDFVMELPEDDARYGVVDVPFETDDGRTTSKLLFVSWIPDTCKVRKRMVYAGSKEYLKSSFEGVGLVINANDPADLDFESCVRPALMKF